LGGFDKKFFASFEDVDLGWKAWICGYKVVIVPNSIVYHSGSQTVKDFSSEIKFHGVKNTLILQLVNFETSYAIPSIFKLFFSSFLRKCFGLSIFENNETILTLPTLKTTFRGVIWVLKNMKYILEKRKNVSLRRVRTTKDLLKMGLITK